MTHGRRFKFLVCVDGSEQSRAAMRFAALRARNIGGIVSLLHVIDPPEFQTLMSVAETIEEENRAEAEQLLHAAAGEVRRLSDLLPELHIRTGRVGDAILELLTEQKDIDALVVGAAPPAQRRGKLISRLPARSRWSLFPATWTRNSSRGTPDAGDRAAAGSVQTIAEPPTRLGSGPKGNHPKGLISMRHSGNARPEYPPWGLTFT